MTRLALIHGFLGTADDWSDIRQRLDHPAVAIDIPNAADWHAGVEAVVSQVPDSSIVVGYSMGARIALGCALKAPHRFKALVMVSGNPGLTDDVREKRWQQDQQVCDALTQLSPEQFLRQWYRQSVFSALTDAQVESLVQEKRQLDKERFVELMKCYSIAKQPNYWDRLGELEMPVHLVAGQRDPKYTRICREMQRYIPDGRLHEFEEAGHIVHRECPQRFSELLNDLSTDLLKENVLR